MANCAFVQRFLANSPSRPGSARPRPGVPPLASRWPLDAASVRHSPRCAVTAFARGREPGPTPGEGSLLSPSRDWTPLASWGWSRLAFCARCLAHFILQFCTLFLRLVATRDSAAGPPVRRRWGWPHFGSAWGPSRGPCGRPSHPLGRVVPGSVTSNLAIHVTRTGGRPAGADLAACLVLGSESAPPKS